MQFTLDIISEVNCFPVWRARRVGGEKVWLEGQKDLDPGGKLGS